MRRPWRRVREALIGFDYQPIVDWIDDRIVHDSRTVVLVFLLLTTVFVVGLGNVSTEAGTNQFTTGLESEQALEDIEREFSPTFEPDSGSTQLIQREQNVLSKPSMLRMLQLQERIEQRGSFRVTSTASVAQLVAQELDPSATTYQEQQQTLKQATPGKVDQAVRDLATTNPQFTGLLSNDFNRQSASASATIGTVSHNIPAGLESGAGQGGSSPLTSIQLRIQTLSENSEGDITVFGSGLISDEFSSVITDSLLIVLPAALVLIALFLSVAYRDLADLLLGVIALIMALVWTFGFLGLAGIPFSQLLISIPPLLLAVGVDFGLHAVNRYREERVLGQEIGESMRITTDQLIVAFFIVTGTTVIGFASNFSSALPPIRDFGLVASIGIVFTFFIFGVFVPAAKVWLDELRTRYPIPTLSTTPLGSEGSALSAGLQGGVRIATRAPAVFLVLVLILSAGVGVYATGVDTSFSQEDFLPSDDNPDFLYSLPEPFQPNEYNVAGTLDFLENNFESTQGDTATVYLKAPMTRESTLESIQRAGEDPPETFVSNNRQADSESIISVIKSQSAQDPEFRALVARNDPDGDGVPEDNLREIYDALLDSPARDQALTYLAEDYSSARVVYTIEGDADQDAIVTDAQTVADRHRGQAIATGQSVVFQEVSDLILESALLSLILTLVGSTLFLVFIYLVLEGQATLGLANMVPVLVTVVFVVASMRALNVPFNSLTATIMALTIGLGVDYSVHVTHRFADERSERPLVPALERTVRGTGGALFGSMLTTVAGIGVLVLALFPVLRQFGLITALSVLYAFIASVVILPSVLVIWDHFVTGQRTLLPLFGIGRQPWQGIDEDSRP
ncbi:efflux RND transporter permease subunit [Salinibaculum rarum]|uniref:efflux RND transporter permease subunit n=1 Tax=Salinibaculum rarum TaxID=3058903 RepID=UPI00265DCE8D|nr:MMPL family transporter [Salinibaculum sp. KK48]